MSVTSRVLLVKRPIKNGKSSLYLRYSPAIFLKDKMKRVYKESLGIYVYDKPKTDKERAYNVKMMTRAEGILACRTESIINEQFGFLDKSKMKGDFLEYYRNLAEGKPSNSKWWGSYQHFEKFIHGKCSFEELDVDVAKKFGEYLMTATSVRRPGVAMHTNTKASYFSTFRAVLKRAYRDRLLKENINDYLDKIEYVETKREYLTLEELKRLDTTPCDIPVLRRAAIFSCFTGLRVSDIIQLEWKHIVKAPDGGWCMRIRTEKTETEATLPISEEALSYCGKRKKEGKVFEDFARGMLNAPLKRWLKRAGITKHITFHCFRHTFATLQLAMGTDLYTVSKMLTHRFISTTQIYADIMDNEKRKSANAISLK